MKHLLSLLMVLASLAVASAQVKPLVEARPGQSPAPHNATHLLHSIQAPPVSVAPASPRWQPAGEVAYPTLPALGRPQAGAAPAWLVQRDPATGLPYWVEGRVELPADPSPERQAAAYLQALAPVLGLKDPSAELQLLEVHTDELGTTHLRLAQHLAGVPVYGAELYLHWRGREGYLANGRYRPTPDLEVLTPTLPAAEALQQVRRELAAHTTVRDLSPAELRLLDGPAAQTQLVVYYTGLLPSHARLAWQVDIYPNPGQRWRYLLDAHTGATLLALNLRCGLHAQLQAAGAPHGAATCTHAHAPAETLPPDGPATANATDLLNQTRLINTYQVGNTYYLLDGSRPMFNGPASTLPDDPAGGILTLNALNTSPAQENFNVAHFTSGNNSWNNRTAVSAHFHAGRAYEYFRTTFNRNSINGQGGAIISLVNVAEDDGSAMDNAFWNGRAMFYGNGNQDFNSPLAKSLDVAGHEMAHGVINATANLEYQDESGALNESFADVFGVMIDRDDWRLGEDVVNPSVFPSGALRDMANPNNGGSQLGQPGWQPAHVDQQYLGSLNNGGVHINSGIPNRAFFLFANTVGKDKAERVYYRALTTYLTRSSQFVDCRLAVIQAATDLYGATEANAAAQAFTTVGIGNGPATTTQTDLPANPGDEFVLYTRTNYQNLFIATPQGELIANPLQAANLLSRPSVTDDGSLVVYVAQNKTLQSVLINWNTGSVTPFPLSNEPVWRNVAVSRDGNFLAAVTDNYDNRLFVYNIGVTPVTTQTFLLYNPTTAQGGGQTNDVQYADVLEWDHSGQFVLYDAYNVIESQFEEPIDYWDINLVRIRYPNGNFANGEVSKLFNNLPDNTSVGNPTFAKNSPYIIAFDYIDSFNEQYFLLGANLETGEVGTIFENGQLSWPSYSPADNRLLFDAQSNQGGQIVGAVNLANDKITTQGNPYILLDGGFNGARWGVWFANGFRPLVDAAEAPAQAPVQVYPLPFDQALTVQWPTDGAVRLSLTDLAGRTVYQTTVAQAAGPTTLPLPALPNGTYLLQWQTGTQAGSQLVVRQGN